MRRGPSSSRAAPALIAALLLLSGCRGAGPVQRVVLVSIDTLRADHVGAYGSADAHTPHIDALAASGVRFDAAISPSPLTLPSHTTLLTGLDPPDHGVRHNGLFRLSDEPETVAERFRAEGHATAAFVSAYVLDDVFGLAQGFDHYDDRLGRLGADRVGPGVVERSADATVDAALAWLGEAPRHFFLFVHLYDPHASYAPPEPWASRFAQNPYAGEVAFADAQLGRLLDAIEARWPDGGTLVALTSDHGESLGDHGERVHGYGLYEATQRVPLILAGPGLPAGRVVAGVMPLADVAPTLLAAAGLAPLAGARGESRLAEVVSDAPVAEEPESRVAWLETLATQLDMGWSPLLGVRTATHKYIRAPRPELYDLAEDPGEQHNRFESEPELAARLDALVGAHSARPTPAASTAAGDRARLAALGYVPADAAPADLGVVGGPNPRDQMEDYERVHRARELLAAGRNREAADLLGEVEVRGYNVEYLYAMAQLRAGDLQEAERSSRRALSLTALPYPLHLLGFALMRQGRLDEAEQAFRTSIEIDATLSDPWMGLGGIAEARGKPDTAAEHYARVRGLPVPDTAAWWSHAALELEAGNGAGARALLAELPPAELRSPEAALRLALAEQRAGRPALALDRLNGALRKQPRHLDLLLQKALVLDAMGRLPAALAARRRALEAAPRSVRAQNDLAWTLGRLGRQLDVAEALVEEVLASRGREPAVLDTLATIQLARGEYGAALATAEEGLALARGRDSIDLRYRRAEALAGLGRRDEARALLAETPPPARGERGPRAQARRRLARLLDAS